MLSVPKMNSGLLVKELWDYCYYSAEVLDYPSNVINNSPQP